MKKTIYVVGGGFFLAKVFTFLFLLFLVALAGFGVLYLVGLASGGTGQISKKYVNVVSRGSERSERPRTR